VFRDEGKGLAVANFAAVGIGGWETTFGHFFTLHKEQPASKVSFHAAIKT
jgi:hypothetical protein